MKLEDFNPAKPELEIDGKIAEFKLFSLYQKAWAFTAFASQKNNNGLENLVHGLRTLDAVIIAKFAWRLIDNKKEIGEENFYNYAEKRENIIKILEVINRVLDISQPGAKVNERMQELKKS